MPPRPLIQRRWLITSTRLLRHAPRATTHDTNSTDAQQKGGKQRKRIGYVVPVKAFSQEVQAFLKDAEGLGLGEVLEEGEEGEEGRVRRGSVVEMRR